MSARNVNEFAEAGSLLIEDFEQDELTLTETLQLYDIATEPGHDITHALLAAFNMGYAAGYQRRDKISITTVGEYLKEQAKKGAAVSN